MVVGPLQDIIAVPLPEQSTGEKMDVQLIVASIATPFLSVFTLTGSGTPNHFVQLRPLASNVKTKRCARKVKSVFAAAGSADGAALVRGASSSIRCGPMASGLVQDGCVL